MASQYVKDITDGQFEQDVLNASTPTIVDFWAEWCAPCRAMAPIFEQLSAQYAGKVQFAKINIDDNPETPSKFSVRGIPTLIVFKDGKVVDQIVGLTQKDALEKALNKVV